MTRFSESFPERDFSQIGEDQARRLLHMGLVQPFRPVDGLIERLTSPGGHEWLRKILVGPPFSSMNDSSLVGGHGLLSGQVMMTQLIGLKEASKRQASDPDRNMRMAARAGYDLAIAAALAHYGRVITGQKRTELMMALTDLAEALPEPWTALVHKAADALATQKQGFEEAPIPEA